MSFRVIEDNGKKLLLAVGYDYKTGTEELKNGYTRLETAVRKIYPDAERATEVVCRGLHKPRQNPVYRRFFCYDA